MTETELRLFSEFLNKDKPKLFGDKAASAGIIAGLGTGAILGKHAARKYGQLREYLKYKPQEEVKKLEAEAEEKEGRLNKLKSDKDYMERYKSAKKDYDSKAKNIEPLFDEDESSWYDEMDKLDEEKRKAIPEGDISSLEGRINELRHSAEKIKKNPKEARKKVSKEYRDDELERKGAVVGSILGGISGGSLGAKI